MKRAGGVPRRRALGAISSIIKTRTSTVVIQRPSESVGSMGQTETTTVNHTEKLWLFDPGENVSEMVAGERVVGDLGALGLDGIDIQKDDRITHGGIEYEVDSVVGYPEDNMASGSEHSDTDYFTIDLVRRST